GERQVSGKVLHESRVESPLVGGQAVPGLYPLWPRRQLRVGRNDSQLQLPLIGGLPNGIPAGIELPLELLPPRLRRMMRGVRGAGCEVQEDRLLRCDGLGVAEPVDGPVRHVRHEVIAVFGTLGGLDRSRVLEKYRVVLVGLAANETVEVVKAQ